MNKKYVGLDVHMASTSYSVRDSEGKVVAEGTVATGGTNLVSLIRGIPGEIHLTFEEGTQAAWLYDLLKPCVKTLIVCDPRKANQKQEDKSDRVDANRLSELLRVGGLSPVYHGEKSTRGLKELVRAHRDLVRDVVRVKNRSKAIFRGRGIGVRGARVYHPDHRESFLNQLDCKQLVQRTQWYLEQLDGLELLRDQAEAALKKEARRHGGYRILWSVPGIGPVRAAQILGVVDTPHRFRTKRQFWKYIGFSVVTKSSSDFVPTPEGRFVRKKWKSTRGLNRNCNKFLKSIYKSAARDAIAKYPSWKAYYEALVKRGLEPEIARVTVARKIAAISLILWKKGQHYDSKATLM
jgi:transposase